MCSFMNRGLKVFAKDDGFLMTRKRSEGRMKRYESAHDLRAWCLSNEEKRRYLIELMQSSSGSEGAFGTYIPVSTLISTMMAMKDVQIEDLEKILAAYRSLNLTDEQRAQLDKLLDKAGTKNLKKGDSTTVLFRRKEKFCHCTPPMEKQELIDRIGELQEELERRDKEAKRQMSCLEKCIVKEKRRVEKVKQSLSGSQSSMVSGSRSSCAVRADNAQRQVEADQSTICALECKLSELKAANQELQTLLDAERSKPYSCDPKQSGAMQEMHSKMEAAQKSEATMREKLASMEAFLRRSGSCVAPGNRPSGCTAQRKSCESNRSSSPPGDFFPGTSRGQSTSQGQSGSRGQSASQGQPGSRGQSTSQGQPGSRGQSASQGQPGSRGHSASQGQPAPRRQSASPVRSRRSLASDSSDTDRSRSNHRCRPPFVSTPAHNSPKESQTSETGSKCGACSKSQEREMVQIWQPSRESQPCRERSRSPVPQDRRTQSMNSSGSSGPCQPCSGHSSSGSRDYDNRHSPKKSVEESDDGRAGPGSGQCWTLMVSRPKYDPAPSPLSVMSERTETLLDSNRQSPFRSPSPSTGQRVLQETCHSSSTCRALSFGSAPQGPAADSFRHVSETSRAPATSQPSSTSGERREIESSGSPCLHCKGSLSRDPSPVLGEHRTGTDENRVVTSNGPGRGIGERRGVLEEHRTSANENRVITSNGPGRGIGEQRGVLEEHRTSANENRVVTSNGPGRGIGERRGVLGEQRTGEDENRVHASNGPGRAIGERKGLMDARVPVPNSSGRRDPSPITGERPAWVQPSVMRDPSPTSVEHRIAVNPHETQALCIRRDPSPFPRETRIICLPRDPVPNFCEQRVILDASKIKSFNPSSRGQPQMAMVRRTPSTNASSRGQSPSTNGERRIVIDASRGQHVRGQSPVTLDGRATLDSRNYQASNASHRSHSPATVEHRNPILNASFRGQSPIPTSQRCSSREQSPGPVCVRLVAPAERTGGNVGSFRVQGGRGVATQSASTPPRNPQGQSQPTAHPTLRKSVPFSSAPYNGPCRQHVVPINWKYITHNITQWTWVQAWHDIATAFSFAPSFFVIKK